MDHLPWSRIEYAALDFETTKKIRKWAEICEIGAIKISEGKLNFPGAYVRQVKPRYGIGKEESKLHGLTKVMLKSERSISDHVPHLRARLSGRLIIAHNAHLEFFFLKKHRIVSNSTILDTKKLARHYFSESETKVGALVARYDIHRRIPPHQYGRELQEHRAYYDSVATAIIFLELIDRYTPRATMGQLRALCEYIPKSR